MSKSPTAKPQASGPGKPTTRPQAQASVPDEDAAPDSPLRRWFAEEGAWWAASFVFHMLLMCSLMLLGNTGGGKVEGDAPAFEAAKEEEPPPAEAVPDKLDKPDPAEVPLDTTELSVETLAAPTTTAIEKSSEVGDPLAGGMTEGGGRPMEANGLPNTGGLGGFTIVAKGPGPRVTGKGGVGVGIGTGTHAGMGGSGYGFGHRGRRGGLGGSGGTKQSEKAVALALNWLFRHQNYDGSWSLDEYVKRCTDASCAGGGMKSELNGATAMGLLPFLAAGQTHETKGPYQQTVFNGLFYLIKHQKPDGDLRDAAGRMYSHGLASICLCEAYGMSHDRAIGTAAQQAINFIQTAQDPNGGGWRYAPKEAGDTSVAGWQVMALKSAQMAYLTVDPAVFARASKFLDHVASGQYKGVFGYTDAGAFVGGPYRTTAIGLLCRQYLGMRRDEGCLREGKDFLMRRLPDAAPFDSYYCYYATQVMHNLTGPDWDAWNRKMRKTLIDAQCHNGCATGSWNTAGDEMCGPDRGGRVMATSLRALTLEVYYRYLPLYKLDNDQQLAPK